MIMSAVPRNSPNSGNAVSYHLGSEEENEGQAEMVKAGKMVRRQHAIQPWHGDPVHDMLHGAALHEQPVLAHWLYPVVQP